MKKIILNLLLFLFSCIAFSQDIIGTWSGRLVFINTEIQVSFAISKSESGYEVLMDIPEQNVSGLSVSSVQYNAPDLNLEINNLSAKYTGKLLNDTLISGVFSQRGISLDLELLKKEILLNRSQYPNTPFPYESIEVAFPNKKAGIMLSGTLTIPYPDGTYPAVILISGSGPQSRDGEIMGHKFFLVIADYLTRNGIAVLRFDDRGVGESEGNFNLAANLDFTTDVEAAFNYLKKYRNIKFRKIGIVGHSEGSSSMFMLAAKNKKVNFLVSLAGIGVKGDSLMLKQAEMIFKSEGMTVEEWEAQSLILRKRYSILTQNKSIEELKEELYTDVIESLPVGILDNKNIKKELDSQIETMTTPWYINLIKYDPIADLKKIKCPVLAINGEKDIQVDAGMNLMAIESILKENGNRSVMVKKYSGLNYLFQHCHTCRINEYVTLEETISEKVLQDMTKWILANTN